MNSDEMLKVLLYRRPVLHNLIHTHTKYCVKVFTFLNKYITNIDTASTAGVEIMEIDNTKFALRPLK